MSGFAGLHASDTIPGMVGDCLKSRIEYFQKGVRNACLDVKAYEN